MAAPAKSGGKKVSEANASVELAQAIEDRIIGEARNQAWIAAKDLKRRSSKAIGDIATKMQNDVVARCYMCSLDSMNQETNGKFYLAKSAFADEKVSHLDTARSLLSLKCRICHVITYTDADNEYVRVYYKTFFLAKDGHSIMQADEEKTAVKVAMCPEYQTAKKIER